MLVCQRAVVSEKLSLNCCMILLVYYVVNTVTVNEKVLLKLYRACNNKGGPMYALLLFLWDNVIKSEIKLLHVFVLIIMHFNLLQMKQYSRDVICILFRKINTIVMTSISSSAGNNIFHTSPLL
jgi:hypothetical protein